MGGGRERSGRKSSEYSSWSEVGVTSLGSSLATVLRRIASTCRIIHTEGNSMWYDRGSVIFTILPAIQVEGNPWCRNFDLRLLVLSCC